MPTGLVKKIAPARIFEIAGDLFVDSPLQSAMAHCVGADFLMGAGLAVTFRTRFGFQDYLQTLDLCPGQVAQVFCDKEDRLVFHLVTKPRSARCRPLPGDFRAAVFELARRCAESRVATLSIPRIGAGLDRLPWPWVRGVLEEAFAGADTEVLVFTLPAERRPSKQRRVAPQRRWSGGAHKTVRARDTAVEGGLARHREDNAETTGATTTPSVSSPTLAANNTGENVPCLSLANDSLAGVPPALADKSLTPDRPIRTSKSRRKISADERFYNDCQRRLQALLEAGGVEPEREEEPPSSPLVLRRSSASPFIKAAKNTVTSTGGSAGRDPKACELTGALSSLASGSTPSIQKSVRRVEQKREPSLKSAAAQPSRRECYGRGRASSQLRGLML
ncbi:uncharacterized protein LOC135934153 [Cloeon dipterum]